MIAVLKHGTTLSQRQHLVDWLKNMNLDVHISEGAEVTVLGLIGDTSRVDMELLNSLDMVETVKRVSEPYKQANRKLIFLTQELNPCLLHCRQTLDC